MPRNWASFVRFSLPIVAVRIEGTIVRALVDTGASQSLIDPRLVKQLALTEEGAASIIGIMSLPIQVPLVSLSRVSMAQHLLKLFKAGIVDLTNLRIGIQLVLGINALVAIGFNSIFQKGGFISCDSELDNSQKSARGRCFGR